MQGAPIPAPPYPKETFDLETDEALRIMVAYEDLASAQLARSVFEHTALALKRGGHGPMRFSMWKLAGPRQPSRMNVAARKAAQADVIVVAAHEKPTMPEALAKWIALWLPEKLERPCGLVALLDRSPSDETQRGIYRYLKEVALFGNLAFFANGRAEDFGEVLQTGLTGSGAPPHHDRIDFETAY